MFRRLQSHLVSLTILNSVKQLSDYLIAVGGYEPNNVKTELLSRSNSWSVEADYSLGVTEPNDFTIGTKYPFFLVFHISKKYFGKLHAFVLIQSWHWKNRSTSLVVTVNTPVKMLAIFFGSRT